jgi:hypothetical protein
VAAFRLSADGGFRILNGSDTAFPMDLRPGSKLGPYEIVSDAPPGQHLRALLRHSDNVHGRFDPLERPVPGRPGGDAGRIGKTNWPLTLIGHGCMIHI